MPLFSKGQHMSTWFFEKKKKNSVCEVRSDTCQLEFTFFITLHAFNQAGNTILENFVQFAYTRSVFMSKSKPIPKDIANRTFFY